MKIELGFNQITWWFWAITLAFIVIALSGLEAGYYLAMAISAFQVVFFYAKSKSIIDFDTQVRGVYFAFTLLGLVDAIRFPFYVLLFLGTMMVVLFDRCGIAVALKYMPWNKQPLTKLKLQ